MNGRITIRKTSGYAVSVDDGQRLFAGSPYEVRVAAPEFRDDVSSTASALLYSGHSLVAECPLLPDPLRRGLRVSPPGSPLAIPAFRDDAVVYIRVEMDASTILVLRTAVVGKPDGGVDAGDQSRWTVESLGQAESGQVDVSDMTQVVLSAPPGAPAVLSVVPHDSSGSFDAYVVVTADSPVPFPFTGVLVGGSAPVWSHQDSFTAPATRWTLHVVKVAGEYYADLRAGRPAGAEVDPDGALVVGVEVNS